MPGTRKIQERSQAKSTVVVAEPTRTHTDLAGGVRYYLLSYASDVAALDFGPILVLQFGSLALGLFLWALEGFPAWVRDRLTAGEPTPLFTDQHVTPTRAGEAAETILDLLPADANGTVHVAARSCVTPYDVGTAVRERLGADPSLIESGSMADVDRPADRPSNTCLEVDRVQRLLGRAQPTLAVDLDEIDHAL